MNDCSHANEPASGLRKAYIFRLCSRVIIFLLCLAIYFLDPARLNILQGRNFFGDFSVFHVLWGIWMADMLQQLIPVKKHIPLGSQKHFKLRFRPIKSKINYEALRRYIATTTRAAYRVMILWVLLIGALGVLYYAGVLTEAHLFLISTAFYVCDLICVLIWCPFRLIMKNRCCTTCRIFNWDHLMMFTPMLFVRGFFSMSLLVMAIAVWLVWELCVLMYPERFWEQSNEALRCSQCTDKLCTQYCQKLRSC